MKNLVFAVLVFCSLICKSQDLLGTTRKDIEFMATAQGWNCSRSGLKGAQLIKVEQPDALHFYYIKDNICTVHIIFYEGVQRAEIGKMLDEKYNKTDTAWYSGNTVIKLMYDESLNGYFVSHRLVK
jgi:hypothetical protein